MKATWSLKEKSTGELKVTVSGDAWVNAQEKAFEKLAKNVEIDGFRKGSAPKALVKKQIREQSILMEAVDIVANDAYTFGLQDQDVTPIARPTLDLETLTAEAATLIFLVTVNPEVTLGQYKGLEVTKGYVTVDEDEVSERLNKMREEYAELLVKEEGTVEVGDTAVIDFEGFKDGESFEGGKGENHPLEIGSNSFIPGFEEALVGLATGEEKDVNVTFPESYQAEHLAGQPVTFKVKVHEIKTRQLPELNDEFVKDLNQEGVETLEQLKEKVTHELTHEKEHQVEDAFDNEVLGKVVEASSVEIPQVMIDEETEAMFEDFKRRLQSQGFTMELYAQVTGQDEAFLKEQISKDAESKVKVRLVLNAVAKAENLDANEEEIEAEFAQIATAYNLEVAKVKELVAPESIAYDLRLKKAFDFIKESVQ
ncbi:MAG TPA: trigger factor [Erysipelotrichaceae bacterium]|nr:trigger factor [Erysipelotrichaceae bacterium]